MPRPISSSFPSRTDTAGNVVLEAQASRLPVVVSGVGGPRENMVAGRTGTVCHQDDADEWTYSDGVVYDVTTTAVWSSVDGDVLTVAAGGPTTATGEGQTQLQASIGPIAGAANITVAHSSFALVSPMTVPRQWHTATLLQDGRVLVTGGQNGGTVLRKAELYDPATGRFTSTGNMVFTRTHHTATLLQNGKVLIVGGVRFEPDLDSLNSAELYDPSTGTFSLTGPRTPISSSMRRPCSMTGESSSPAAVT